MIRPVLAVLALLLLAPAARGATVSSNRGDRYLGTSTLVFAAAPGGADSVTVAGVPDGRIVVVDAGEPLTPGAGCTAVDPNSAICDPTPFGPFRTVRASLGDGNDQLRASTAPGAEWSSVVVSGGPGNDTIDLSGVRNTTLQDQFFTGQVDGGPGQDVLRGSSGADSLAGGSGRDEIHGGPGDDELDGDGATSDRAFDHPARDVLDGGPGEDTVSYAASPRGVAVNLTRPGSAGARKEGDRLSGIEDVVGSAFSDTLTGGKGPNDLDGFREEPFARKARGGDRLTGGGGADTLEGTGRSDRLSGGAGDDELDLGGGADHYTCGAGDDTADAAGTAVLLPGDCESVDDGAYTFGRLHVEKGARLVGRLDPDLPAECDERVGLRARRGRAVLGTTAWTDPPPARFALRLNGAGRRLARRGGDVVVRTVPCNAGARSWILRLPASRRAG